MSRCSPWPRTLTATNRDETDEIDLVELMGGEDPQAIDLGGLEGSDDADEESSIIEPAHEVIVPVSAESDAEEIPDGDTDHTDHTDDTDHTEPIEHTDHTDDTESIEHSDPTDGDAEPIVEETDPSGVAEALATEVRATEVRAESGEDPESPDETATPTGSIGEAAKDHIGEAAGDHIGEPDSGPQEADQERNAASDAGEREEDADESGDGGRQPDRRAGHHI